MTRDAETWQRLNAYVDGELSPSEAAEVARAIAARPDWATAAAAIQETKSGVATLAGEVSDEVQRLPMPGPASLALGVRGLLVVATLIAVAVAAGLLLSGQEVPREGLLAEALGQHGAWPSESAPTPASARVHPVAVELTLVPDLSSFGLTLTRLRESDLGLTAPAKSLLYEGRRGCRLTLFFLPPGEIPAEAASLTAPDEGVRIAWLPAERPMALAIATSMDSDRFQRIAASLTTQLERLHHPSAEERTAIAGDPVSRRPCLV